MRGEYNRQNPIRQAEQPYWKSPIGFATMAADMNENQVRRRLAELVEKRQTDLKTLSLSIGRNHAYLQQYLKRTKPSPRRLQEEDRQALARELAVEPRELGSLAWRPSYLDLFLFPLRCPVPQCATDFRIAIRGLVSRDAVHCPQCGSVVDLKKLKPAINDLARIATELDKLAE